MIRTVSFQGSTYADIPNRFEAGTPAIAQAIGLGEAIRHHLATGWEVIQGHEAALLERTEALLGALPGLTLLGRVRPKLAVVSFVVEGLHPHDLGTLLDEVGVAIRAGHHCAQPLMQRLGLSATARASFHHTNTFEEVDRLVAGVRRAQALFGLGQAP
jgi:cysteine desulfurase/selenocysteine lyase